jgi:hypothetical protein
MWVLPCCYKSRLDTIFPTKVMKVIARPDEELDPQENDFTLHHILLDDCDAYFAIQGPYYRSLLSAFHTSDGDTITFSWDERTNIYDVSVQSEQNEPKNWVGFPGNFGYFFTFNFFHFCFTSNLYNIFLIEC